MIHHRSTATPFPYTTLFRSGSVYRIVGYAEDITEHKRIQESLRTSEERLERVIHGSSDGFWDGNVLPDEPWSSPRTPVWWSPRSEEHTSELQSLRHMVCRLL